MEQPWYERYHPLLLAALLTVHSGILAASIFYNGVSWDEGWNFCVARNWVEANHYGCSFNGQFTTPRLSQGVVTVASSALGFKLFGIGVVQGRIFQALITLLALITLYRVALLHFGKNAALLSLLYLLGVSGDQRIHPGTLGGQGWGETSVILFVALATLLIASLTRIEGRNEDPHHLSLDLLTILGAGIALGLSTFAKMQAAPFVATALVATLLVALLRREGSFAISLALVGVAAYFTRYLLFGASLPQQVPMTTEGTGVEHLLEATALVFGTTERSTALLHILGEGLLATIGLTWITRNIILSLRNRPQPPLALVFLCTLCASWLLWYLLAAQPYRRYLAPSVLLAAPVVGAMLFHWLRERSSLQKLRYYLKVTLLAIACFNVILLVKFLFQISDYNTDLTQTARYLNLHYPPSTLVETYDSQLFFLLNQPYRYPPDQGHVDVILGAPSASSSYNPLTSPANVFILGDWSRVVFRTLFIPILTSTKFSCRNENPSFTICERE